MDEELERLINTLLDGDIRCYVCKTQLEIQADDLEQQSAQVYTSQYNCRGEDCDLRYNIEVEDMGPAIRFEAREQGTEYPSMGKTSRKQPLQKESHPVRHIVDAAEELTKAIDLLEYNQQQLQNAQEKIEAEGIDQDSQFHSRVRADIHNYTAAAYSFEKILEKNVKPHLPNASPIEDAMDDFRDVNEVIKALRTYAQHHLTLPSSIAHFWGQASKDGKIAITVPMEELDDFRPGDPEASFEPIEGNYIHVVDRVNKHYQAVENLVDAMLEVAEEEYKDQVEEYRRVTSYPELEEG